MNGAKMLAKGLLAVAGAVAAAGAAHAQDTVTVAYNVAVGTDYVFRGISQNDSEWAYSGGVDIGYGQFYAGVWASKIDFGLDEQAEVDLYAGWKPKIGDLQLDLGFIYYAYPGLSGSYNGDYVEVKAAASAPVNDKLTLGAAIYYSPEFTFTPGDPGTYAEINGAYALSDKLALTGAFGRQQVDTNGYYFDPSDSKSTDHYETWNVGLTYTEGGFSIDGRYYDTSLSDDSVTIFGPSGNPVSDNRIVGSIKFAF